MSIDLTVLRATSRRRHHQGFMVVFLVVFLISFLKGFRMPNLWAATQFAINYSQGFVRRGLMGELTRHLGGPEVFHYNSFAAIAFSILLVTVVVAGIAIHRALFLARRDWGYKLALLVFLASPGLAFFIHEVGYFDGIGLLGVLVLLLFVRRFRSPFHLILATTLVGILLAFVHEVLPVMFGSVFLFVMLCRILADMRHHPDDWRRVLLLFLSALVGGALLLVFSGLVGTWGTATPERTLALQRWVSEATNFPLRPDVFEAETRSSVRNLTRMMPWYWGMVFKVEPMPPIKAWLAIFPSFTFLFLYGQVLIRQLRLPPVSTWCLHVGYSLAVCAPLALNFVGWDWNRWNAIAILAAFSCLLSIRLIIPSASPRTMPPWVLTLGMVAFALSLASDNVLFDRFQIQFYPFEKQFEFIYDLFDRGFKYLPRG